MVSLFCAVTEAYHAGVGAKLHAVPGNLADVAWGMLLGIKQMHMHFAIPLGRVTLRARAQVAAAAARAYPRHCSRGGQDANTTQHAHKPYLPVDGGEAAAVPGGEQGVGGWVFHCRG